MNSRSQACAGLAIALAGLTLATSRGEAHKQVTSPYTYNADVFPIMRDRCGRCHVPGGVAPMSLLTYKDAFPWGESIRTELIAGHMPPWRVEGGSATLKNVQGLTARELNVLLTWATGGNPIGDPERTPAPMAPRDGWPLGPPDQIVRLPTAFTLAAETQAHTQEFTVPTNTTEDRWIRAVDLLPETPAIVRSATISLSSAGASSASEKTMGAAGQVLSLWLPGEDPVTLDAGAGFRLPAGAALTVRVNYRKTWEYERKEMTDRSAVGLYFTAAPATAVRPLLLAAAPDVSLSDRHITFGQVVDEDLRALAVYPDARLTNARLDIRAVHPDGARLEMIRFRPQANWTRRYWFEHPVPLPKGTRIEVAASFDQQDALLPPGATPVTPGPIDPSSLRVTLDVIGATR